MRVTGSDEPSCCVHAPQVLCSSGFPSKLGMTARGALSRQKERGHRAVRIKEASKNCQPRVIPYLHNNSLGTSACPLHGLHWHKNCPGHSRNRSLAGQQPAPR